MRHEIGRSYALGEKAPGLVNPSLAKQFPAGKREKATAIGPEIPLQDWVATPLFQHVAGRLNERKGLVPSKAEAETIRRILAVGRKPSAAERDGTGKGKAPPGIEILAERGVLGESPHTPKCGAQNRRCGRPDGRMTEGGAPEIAGKNPLPGKGRNTGKAREAHPVSGKDEAIGRGIENRLRKTPPETQKRLQVVGIPLVVPVKERREVRLRRTHARVASFRDAAVAKTEKPNSCVLDALRHLRTTVGGAVVHHDQ